MISETASTTKSLFLGYLNKKYLDRIQKKDYHNNAVKIQLQLSTNAYDLTYLYSLKIDHCPKNYMASVHLEIHLYQCNDASNNY